MPYMCIYTCILYTYLCVCMYLAPNHANHSLSQSIIGSYFKAIPKSILND